MITRTNLESMLNSIDDKDKRRILNSDKEYCVIYAHIFNVGCRVSVTLTNDYNRYKNVSNDGNCLIELGEVQQYFKGEGI